MKLTVSSWSHLSTAALRAEGFVASQVSPTTIILRRRPMYPKGFSSLAEAHWRRLDLDQRSQWKDALARAHPIPTHLEPTWSETIDAYRSILFTRLTAEEPLDAPPPATLDLHSLGPPVSLTAAAAARLRTRIAELRASLHA